MGIELLAHIGVPLIVVVVLLIFRAASRVKPIGWESCNDIAFELAILAIGSTGGIFVDPGLIRHFGVNSGLYGIVVVLIDLCFAGVIVYRGRGMEPYQRVSGYTGVTDLFFGCLCVATTVGALYLAK